MPSFIATGLALLAAVGSVSADYYYGYGTGTGAAPVKTHAPSYPYYNGTHPHLPYGTGYHPHPVDYTTTTVCETVYHTDSYGHTTYTEVIPVYTTVVPLTTSTVYAYSTATSAGATYTETYSVGTTVYPVTTYYAHATGTGVGKVYPTYAKGAGSTLKVSGLAAVAVVMVAAAL